MKILFLILLITLNLSPQNRWIKLNGPEGGFIGGLITKGDTIIAGTANYPKGLAFYSFDKGETWNRPNSKVNDGFAQFCFTDDNGIIAANRSGGIYKSFDLINWFSLLNGNFRSVGKDFTGRLYAGNEFGAIYTSSNHGLTWTHAHYETTIFNFLSIYDNKILAGGHKTIFYKDTLSTVWSTITLDTNADLHIFSDPSGLLYANDCISIFISADSGSTWQKQPQWNFSTGEYMYGCIYNTRLIGGFGDETGWFGYGWGAAVSDDRGITWRWSQNGLPPYTTGGRLAIIGADTYLSTWGAGVFKSTNYGDSWTPVNNGLTAALVTDIHFDNESNLYSAAWCSGISKSTDNGLSWRMINTGLTNVYCNSIISDDSGVLYCATDRGLFRSYDKGEHWGWVSNLFGTKLAKDKQNRIYVCSYGAGIYRTTNQGNLWVRVDNGFTSGYVFSLAFDSLYNMYAGTTGGALYKTTNDGTSWTKVYQGQPTSDLTSIAVSPNGTVFAAMRGEGVLRSTDNGSTFQRILPGNALTVAVNSNGDLYSGFRPQGIYLSTDNGDNWQILTANMQLTEVSDFIFRDGEIYLGTDESVWKSNPDFIPVSLTAFTCTITGKTAELKWITATETNNRGFEIERKFEDEDWAVRGFVEGHGTTTVPNEYSFQDELPGEGKYLYRIKQLDFDGTFTYSEEIPAEIKDVPGRYSLEQNYPNPFNPSTTIKYSLPQQSRVSIIIYDALGREITKLDEEKPAGEYEVTWNAKNYPTGVYFCRMSAGNYSETRKLVLMK